MSTIFSAYDVLSFYLLDISISNHRHCTSYDAFTFRLLRACPNRAYSWNLHKNIKQEVMIQVSKNVYGVKNNVVPWLVAP
jgi:hypothetical protein